jgi:hypothetical protein
MGSRRWSRLVFRVTSGAHATDDDANALVLARERSLGMK